MKGAGYMPSFDTYQIVGRYMDGAEVTGYHLICSYKAKTGRYSREQVIFLAARKQINNCSGEFRRDKVIFEGYRSCS